jgi:POT family proton-dependent oligopeptide transporter
VKFSLGLLQLAAGFGVLWLGAQQANGVGLVGMQWLILAYLLHTTGELCLSPVGLSMVTRMSPGRIVSMTMGGWFLATAFSQQLSSVIAKLTSVEGGEGGGAAAIPPPIETVHVYGDVFGQVGLWALVAGLLLLVASPMLSRMMHEDKPAT